MWSHYSMDAYKHLISWADETTNLINAATWIYEEKVRRDVNEQKRHNPK